MTTRPFRVWLTVQVVPGKESGFEQAWVTGHELITAQEANLGHWLYRSSTEEQTYYVVSDWRDETSFRAFESSPAHLAHRKELYPFRSGGAMAVMTELNGAAARTSGAAR